MSTKLFIDFDGVYQNKKPEKFVIVITNKYLSKDVINVNINTSIRNKALKEFEHYFSGLPNNIFPKNFDLDKSKVHLFNNFFLPLSLWLNTIDELLLSNKISSDSEVEFSSYANNPNAFLFEAEGEINRKFLYNSSYYLSYYIKEHLKIKKITNVKKGRNKTLKSYISFYIRGPITIIVKSLQLLLYKIFFVKRKHYNSEIKQNKPPFIVISSRGIIQTQFISEFYQKTKRESVVLINESSSKPFRNLKAAKKNFDSFYYCEGLISLRQLFIEIFLAVQFYLFKDSYSASFMELNIPISKIISELGVYKFHMKTYAHSVNNALNNLELKADVNKIISFEMLAPFSYYLKSFTRLPVIQIQTTLMTDQKGPNFIYSDCFYFYNRNTYKLMDSLKFLDENKIDYLQNVRYLGLVKQPIKITIKTITYFMQPMYEDEENELMNFLKLYCDKYEKILQIKPHPRSKTPTLNSKSTIIIDSTIDSKNIVMNSDLVITRTSSIGQDAWFANVPVVFFINGSFNKNIGEFMPDDYLGLIRNDITIDEFHEKLPGILSDFYNHYLHKDLQVDYMEIKKKIFRNLNSNKI